MVLRLSGDGAIEGFDPSLSGVVTTDLLSASANLLSASVETRMPFTYASASPSSPIAGETWFDSSASASSAIPYFYDGNTDEFVEYSQLQPPVAVEYLVIAGGGGGGSRIGGGGGAGGYRSSVSGEQSGAQSAVESPLGITQGTVYTITIGGGGVCGIGTTQQTATNGSNSVFGSITSTGGGRGGQYQHWNANNGGSGGGGAGLANTTAGTGTANQGRNGGAGNASHQAGAGGGGAASVGGVSSSNDSGGAGGAGLSSLITGNTVTRAGGGGGSATSAGAGAGGAGGGGAGAIVGANATNGTNNLGGGGGGARNAGDNTTTAGGNGGSGVVIIRYSNTFKDALTTGNPLFDDTGGYKIYTFNSSGTIAW